MLHRIVPGDEKGEATIQLTSLDVCGLSDKEMGAGLSCKVPGHRKVPGRDAWNDIHTPGTRQLSKASHVGSSIFQAGNDIPQASNQSRPLIKQRVLPRPHRNRLAKACRT